MGSSSAAYSKRRTRSVLTRVTAIAGSDYAAAAGDVIIPAGQTSATVTVPVRGDRLGEANETFAVNLSGATNATIADSGATIGLGARIYANLNDRLI